MTALRHRFSRWAAMTLAVAVLAVLGASSAAAHVRLDARLHHRAVLVGGDGTNYLRVLLEAERVKLDKRLPLNVVLVLDRSGSMSGAKIRNVREAATYVIDALQPGDTVSVVSFSAGVQVLQPAALVESINRGGLKRRILRLRDSGSTNMLAALAEGIAQAGVHASTERVNRVILLSDGLPDKQDGLVPLAASGLPKGIFLTTMGVGADYNETLMSHLADAGNGNYYFIEKAAEIAGIFQRELQDLMAVVAREGVVTVQLAEGVTVEQVYGYESSARPGRLTIPVGDLFGGARADILVRLKTPAGAAAAKMPVASVRFAYHDAVDNRGARADAEVHQEVTTNEARVGSEVDRDVGGKVVRVQAAEAKKEAMRLYEAGRGDEARRVLRSRGAAVRTSAGTMADADEAASEAAELDDLSRELEAAPASGSAASTLRKKVRAGARKSLR